MMDVNTITEAYMDQMANQNTSATKLSQKLEASDYSKASEDELLKVCKDFESYFLEQVFKGMQKTVDCFKEEGTQSNYTESMLGFFKDETIQELASQSTEKNGLGLAQTLYEQMKRNYGL